MSLCTRTLYSTVHGAWVKHAPKRKKKEIILIIVALCVYLLYLPVCILKSLQLFGKLDAFPRFFKTGTASYPRPLSRRLK